MSSILSPAQSGRNNWDACPSGFEQKAAENRKDSSGYEHSFAALGELLLEAEIPLGRAFAVTPDR